MLIKVIVGLVVTLTLVIIVLAIFYYPGKTGEQLSQVEAYVSMVVSTLAFLWLIAGYFIQIDESKKQRKALLLQHQAVKYTAWQQIAALVNEFRKSYPTRKIAGLQADSDIYSVIYNHGIREIIPKLLHSEDNNTIRDAFFEWLRVRILFADLAHTLHFIFNVHAECVGCKPICGFKDFLNSLVNREIENRYKDIPYANSLFDTCQMLLMAADELRWNVGNISTLDISESRDDVISRAELKGLEIIKTQDAKLREDFKSEFLEN